MFHREARRLPVIANTPPVPSAIDAEIDGGSTVAIEAMPQRMQAAKRMPTLSLSQLIEQKTWENGQLRRELAHLQRKQAAAIYLHQEVQLVEQALQQALSNFRRLDDDAEPDSDADVMMRDRTASEEGLR